jgi:hypothetical protein
MTFERMASLVVQGPLAERPVLLAMDEHRQGVLVPVTITMDLRHRC